MDFSYNRFNELEDIELILCNPNGTEMAVLEAENRIVTLRLNDLSELTFDVYKYTKRKDGTEEVSPYYDMIETRRLVHVTNIGWFLITKVEEIEEADCIYKAVSCQSHQVAFQGFGFITEERVYKFYDPSNPHDAGYDSTDIGAIPSVVGQMYQQLMVDQDISSTDRTPTSDYGIWTLTYIDPALWWDESRDDNVARTFTDKTTNGFDFMVNLAEDAFEIVFLFDFEYHTIKVKQVQDITTMSDILLSFSNVLTQMDVTEDATDLVTVLDCTGDGLDITLNNPMGTNYIVDFSYYMQETTDEYGNTIYPWMSKELIDALNDWQEIYDECKEPYQELVKQLKELYQQQVEVSTTITYYNTELLDIQNILDQIYTADKKQEQKDMEDGIEDDDDDDDLHVNGDEIFTAEEVLAGAYSLDPSSEYHSVPFCSDGSESNTHVFYKDDDNFNRGYDVQRFYTREPDPNDEDDEGEYYDYGFYVLSGTTRSRTVEGSLDITEDTGKSNTQPSELHDDKSLISYPYFIDYAGLVPEDKIRDTVTITESGFESDTNSFRGWTTIVSVSATSGTYTSLSATVRCPESLIGPQWEVKLLVAYQLEDSAASANVEASASGWYVIPIYITIPLGEQSGSYKAGAKELGIPNEATNWHTRITEATEYVNRSQSINNNEAPSYCKLQPEVTSIEYDVEDEDNYTVTYGIKSFIRYSSYNNAWRWKEIYDNALEVAQGEYDALQECIDAVRADMDAIVEKCNLMNYFADRPDLLRELRNYWAEGSYTNNNLAVLDDMTIADMIDLGNELMEYGAIELSKVCQPRFKFSVESLKFIMLPEFKDFTQQLEMGRVITVEKSENLWYYPALTEMQFSLDDFEDFTMTFSNRLRLDDWGYTYADLITSAASTTKTVANNWVSALTSYERRAESIDGLLREPLNATLRLAEANMYNQSFVIDDTGILGRKYTDDSQTTFNDEQMRITNNVIIFTDDRWETIKTALGMIVYNDYTDLDEDGKPKTKTAYGLLAEVLVGELILGETLEIVNETGTVRIDKDGITVTTADGTDIFRVNINGDPYIRTYITSEEASLTYETQTSANSTTTRLEGLITANTTLINQTADEIYAEVSTVQKSLEADISTNTSAITKVTERVSSLEMTSDSIKATITGIETVVGIELDSDGNVVVEGASIVEQISQIDMRLNNITLTVGSTSTSYGTLESVLESLYGADDTIKSSLDNLDIQLGYTNDSLGELKTALYGDEEGSVGTLGKIQTDLSDLTSTVESNSGQLNSVTGALSDSNGNLISSSGLQTSVDNFGLQLANDEETLAKIRAALTGDDEELINVQTVVEQVASIEINVEAITNTVSSIQTKYDGEITEIQTNISTLEQTATSITAMVTEEYALKADGSTATSGSSFGYVLTSSNFSLVSNGATVFSCDSDSAYIVGFDVVAIQTEGSKSGYTATLSWVNTGTSSNPFGGTSYSWRLDLLVTRTSTTNNAVATVVVEIPSGIMTAVKTYTVSFAKGVASITTEGISSTATTSSSAPSLSGYSATVNAVIDQSGGYIAYTKSAYNDSNEGVYIGTDGIGVGPGSFWVNSDGYVHLESATFGSGGVAIDNTSVNASVITADTLTVGDLIVNGDVTFGAGFRFDDNVLTAGSGDTALTFGVNLDGGSTATIRATVSVGSGSSAGHGTYNYTITVTLTSALETDMGFAVCYTYTNSYTSSSGVTSMVTITVSGGRTSGSTTVNVYGSVTGVYFNTTGSNTMSLSSAGGPAISVTGHLIPNSTASNPLYDLGTTNYPWREVNAFVVNQTSDERLKHSIDEIRESEALSLIQALSPRSYVFEGNQNISYGFIAQEVEQALVSIGADGLNLVRTPQGDDGYYGLSYNDLIAPMVKVIQYILKKIQ